MASYAARRLLAAIPVLFFVSFVTFGLIRLAPGDPVLIVLGGDASARSSSSSCGSSSAWSATRSPSTSPGSAGRSSSTSARATSSARRSVDLIVARLPHHDRARRAVGAHRDRWSPSRSACSRRAGARVAVDYAGSLLRASSASAPRCTSRRSSGVLVFAVWLGWLPAFGQGEDPVDQLRHLLLPAVRARARASIALTSRMTRSAMLEVARVRLHRGRAREGAAGTDDPREARAAQRAHPGADGDLAAGRLPASSAPCSWRHAGPRRPRLASSPTRSRTATTRSSRRRSCS